MNLKSELLKILTNKKMLYVVFVLSVLNIIGYLILGNITAVMYFILLGLLVYNFDKNMIIVLGIPLILVNLVVYQPTYKYTESFSNSTSSTDTNTNTKSKEEYKKTINKINKNKQNSKSSQGLPITPLENNNNTTSETTNESSEPVTEESFEVGRAKQSGGYNIDYASTVEDAYDQLNQIIGSDGIKKLTSDTQNLMKQQLQLAEAMNSITPMVKSMAPLMQQAQGLLGNLGVSTGNLGSITEMAKKFTNSNKVNEL
jgi:hypothetical protein